MANPRKSPLRKSPLAEVLDAWAANTYNDSEEFWQKLFEDTPACLVPVLGGRAYTLRSQCYVGGKSFNNKGGKVLDFLAFYASNVACVEIKTPATRLLGRRYRDNVYSPSSKLAGACIQVLESRRSLMRNVANLNEDGEPVIAAHPHCYVIAGNLQAEQFDSAHQRSFELFRSGLRDVTIVTFDEIFDGVRNLLAAALRDTDHS
jgi:hypothetical protein